MAEFDKWWTQASGDDPVTKVARRALRHRLRAVSHFLKQAEGTTSRTPELVHQLRVWCRRTATALQMFEKLTPKRSAGKLKRTIRKLRRLGGQARDCDLLLRSLADEPTTAATVRISRRLRKRRHDVQHALDRAKRKWIDQGKLKPLRKKVLAGIRWPKKGRKSREPDFRFWARERIELLLAALVAFDASDLQLDDRMHAMRIAGKRLRYAAELSVVAFPQLGGGLYDQLVDLQDRLGDAVDHLANIERLGGLLEESSEADRAYLVAAIAQQQTQLMQKRRKLARWWTPARRRELEGRWRGALGSDR